MTLSVCNVVLNLTSAPLLNTPSAAWVHEGSCIVVYQARIQDFLQGGGGVNDGRVLAPAPTGGLGLINIRLRYIASIEYSERFFLIFFFLLVKKFVEKKNWWSRAGGGVTTPPPPGSAPVYPVGMVFVYQEKMGVSEVASPHAPTRCMSPTNHPTRTPPNPTGGPRVFGRPFPEMVKPDSRHNVLVAL